MSFEKNLKKLEDIAKKMRDENIELEDSIKMFEDGISISKELEKQLNSFEKRIDIVVEKNGEDHLEEFK